MPARFNDACLRTSFIASHAAPDASENPNFTSSWAVEIASWV